MHIKPIWRFFNRGLLIILAVLIISTIGSVIYLAHTLLGLRALTTEGGNAVATALVLQDIVINLQGAQSGVRGYIITGDKDFLKPYTASQSRIPADLVIIKSGKTMLLTPEERKKILDLVNKRMTLAAQSVQTYDSGGFDSAQQTIATRQGDNAMINLKDYIASVSSRDLQGIGPKERQSLASVHLALWIAVVTSVLIIGFCAAIIWYFRKAILHERALESTKNEFLSLASHQLRTPATNVKQYIALLLDGYMGNITDEQRRALDIAYKNNESEIRIMNTLLDVAKLDLQRIELRKAVVDISKTVRRAVRDKAAAAKEAGIAMRFEAPSRLMAKVDEEYIKGVVDNLLDNAVKYSKSGSRVKVRVWREGDLACVSVRDRGIGMKRRDLVRLFTKFTRLDNEFSANSQGSGLGLYWVRKVVELHRGTIEIASQEGKGSVFTVRLPVR